MRFLFAILALIGTMAPAVAHDRGMRDRPPHQRSGPPAPPERRERAPIPMRDPDIDRIEERRERMRALREEMLRQFPRSQHGEERMERPERPDRRDLDAPRPPPSREAGGWRRLTPEERRQFRRELRDAYRD